LLCGVGSHITFVFDSDDMTVFAHSDDLDGCCKLPEALLTREEALDLATMISDHYKEQ